MFIAKKNKKQKTNKNNNNKLLLTDKIDLITSDKREKEIYQIVGKVLNRLITTNYH